MGFLWWIVIGFAAGALAKYIMPGKENMGLLLTTGLGIAGAVVGGFVFQLLGITLGGGVIGDLVGGVVGALILLWAYKQFFAKKGS